MAGTFFLINGRTISQNLSINKQVISSPISYLNKPSLPNLAKIHPQILMAGNAKSFFCLALLLATFLFTSGARPLNDAEASSGISMTKRMEVLLDDLSLAIEGIKTGGPSSGGDGHAVTDVVINSGPSSGGGGH
ncbi:hypothetical protein PVK06_015690 [Gossypium arboreum]|uniref:Uncharacterized protein n=2 Tax=Gossypium TaxID=3633 RepID=A0ABR0PYJ2_GOSAR|nr:hypothetical protein PVK06_015690 [Gossypium arboreum]